MTTTKTQKHSLTEFTIEANIFWLARHNRAGARQKKLDTTGGKHFPLHESSMAYYYDLGYSPKKAENAFANELEGERIAMQRMALSE